MPLDYVYRVDQTGCLRCFKLALPVPPFGFMRRDDQMGEDDAVQHRADGRVAAAYMGTDKPVAAVSEFRQACARSLSASPLTVQEAGQRRDDVGVGRVDVVFPQWLPYAEH